MEIQTRFQPVSVSKNSMSSGGHWEAFCVTTREIFIERLLCLLCLFGMFQSLIWSNDFSNLPSGYD